MKTVLFRLVCWMVHLFDKEAIIFMNMPNKDITALWADGALRGFYEPFDDIIITTKA